MIGSLAKPRAPAQAGAQSGESQGRRHIAPGPRLRGDTAWLSKQDQCLRVYPVSVHQTPCPNRTDSKGWPTYAALHSPDASAICVGAQDQGDSA